MSDHEARSEDEAVASSQVRPGGTRTRVLLILAASVITLSATLVSLSVIRQPLQHLIVEDVSSELLYSLSTFESMQTQRMASLDRESALLADLPSLKALMTTSDERTIADAGVEFWRVSEADLFALADPSGAIKAAYLTHRAVDEAFRSELNAFLTHRGTRFLVSAQGLYGCSVQPLYFGSRENGTLLGFVITGFAIDDHALAVLGDTTRVEALYRSGSRILASSGTSAARIPAGPLPRVPSNNAFRLDIAGEEYLAVAHDVSAQATAPLTLVELKTLEEEKRVLAQINRLVLLAGILALGLGAGLMVALSRFVTRPLEQLAAGVRAFAEGNSTHLLPDRGTREVRELSNAFARMRGEIRRANQALIESERLATIGRMARSVSHDLRHYLSAIYANSEFLASETLPHGDRHEVLAEIRTAVDGTTEMLESLLMFSRTGASVRRVRQSIPALVESVLSLVRSHPDAAGIKFTVNVEDPEASQACVDGKQLERAIYNLLLNACQAPRDAGVDGTVTITIKGADQQLWIDVADNGNGVPQSIRGTLFEPFVSEGKHKGSGLGLTLAQSIAVDHGGSVILFSTRYGETIFRMAIARTSRDEASQAVGRAEVE